MDPSVFTRFWENIDRAVAEGTIVSVAEVLNEIVRQNRREHISEWAKRNKKTMFPKPNRDELDRLREVLSVRHFRQLIEQRKILSGVDSADPFIVAAAMAKKACVVTEEKAVPNGAKIPNVCDHFGVECIKVAELYRREDWRF